MPHTDYDVVIAGGGMVGASLALCLDQFSRAGLRVLVVESFPLPPVSEGRPSYRPSFDARSTALSYGSAQIYDELAIWPLLKEHICTISQVHVSDRGHFGSVLMNAASQGWPALGYVVENAWLGNVLLNQLRLRPQVDFLSPASVASVSVANGFARLLVRDGNGEREITTQLVAVADGADSGLRAQLGIAASVDDYHQVAVIANVATEKAHGGCAYERFTERGPLALLPLLADESGASRSALVWTFPEGMADEVAGWNDDEFLAELQRNFGYRLGRLRKVGQRNTFPLRLMQADEQVRGQVVVLGNAAHSLHPVAGQGFNLALRDVACLSGLIADAHAKGRNVGDLALLQTYLQQQRGDQFVTTTFSDRLTHIFSNRKPVLSLLRNLGLAALDLTPPLKSQFVARAAGILPGAATE
ncbi:2-octaprenyl-6-methoxyphenol hydroxylase [Zhongshania aliphaticivorans]|uniref:2-octaprenyl-6-methoxyphenol hydroxylase n=1 Tax=Zhongshania aliphaticivorans TaxID=1470434 RepID=A0A5S9NA11_9GAMM|nr:2-octaprenyl-6-methoxyphenyl hydroxylase [Zhongshania aliphaticivorans]CAA0079906.1 2-octaprenyl-6-methoxyphenol hydroxylase [Zhongshania aliphaticivorans]CAA0085974.1 2-octaprenyl-6-methoxyphenol hydroxylase [Zhongshania aliphaticivorans]